MNKLLAIIAIISITVLSVNGDQAVPGYSVSCGTANGANPATCTGCGAPATQSLFSGDSGADTCLVTDCAQDPGANLNGWMCRSCYGMLHAYSVYTHGSYYQLSACVLTCTNGFTADNNRICQPPAQPGTAVSCGAVNGINPATCTGCGATVQTQGLFTGVASTATCKVTDCTKDPGANLNGWMCKSCYGATYAHAAYANGQLYQGSACVSTCTGGATADSNQICQPPIPGISVSCGTANGTNPATCTGCGATVQTQGLFTGVSNAATCKVIDCTKNPGANLNGWMCKSCYGATNAHAAYANGPLYQGSVCVSTCTGGATADSNQICQPPIPGTAVSCGAVNGVNSATCTGCGATVQTQGLFTGVASAATCKVTDCTQDPGANLNGWMCKSCYGATNAHAAYANGPLYQGSACVATCTGNTTVDNNQICQPPIPGISVSCGTANGSNPATCTRCGANVAAQALFKGDANADTCKVTDCTQNPGANLNGWMCKSCSGATNAYPSYSAGKLFSGSTCVASCPQGQTADSNNICQINSQSQLLALALSILFLCLLF